MGRGGCVAYLRQSRGFTFIEVLVSVAIIAACFLPLLGLFMTSAYAGQHARYMTIASQLAVSRLEDLRTAGYTSVLPESRRSFTTLPQYSGYAEFEYQVDVAEVEPGLKEVAITVYWARPRNTARVSVTTLVRQP